MGQGQAHTIDNTLCYSSTLLAPGVRLEQIQLKGFGGIQRGGKLDTTQTFTVRKCGDAIRRSNFISPGENPNATFYQALPLLVIVHALLLRDHLHFSPQDGEPRRVMPSQMAIYMIRASLIPWEASSLFSILSNTQLQGPLFN